MILVLDIGTELAKELLEIASAQGDGVNEFVAKDLSSRWTPHLTEPEERNIHQVDAENSQEEDVFHERRIA